MNISKGHELPARRERFEDGFENAVLCSRQHVAPGQTADDAMGALAVQMRVEILGGIVNDFATIKSPAQRRRVRGIDFDGEQPAAAVQSFQQQSRERPAARPQFDDEVVRFEIAAVHHGA